MKAHIVIQLAALSGFLSVVLGAFGAHGLKNRLGHDMMAIYHTGIQYQFLHTLALLVVGLLIQQWGKSMLLSAAAISYITGILVFSGSLYVLSLTGIRWLGAITPIGGTAFLAGWICLFIAAYKAG